MTLSRSHLDAASRDGGGGRVGSNPVLLRVLHTELSPFLRQRVPRSPASCAHTLRDFQIKRCILKKQCLSERKPERIWFPLAALSLCSDVFCCLGPPDVPQTQTHPVTRPDLPWGNMRGSRAGVAAALTASAGPQRWRWR